MVLLEMGWCFYWRWVVDGAGDGLRIVTRDGVVMLLEVCLVLLRETGLVFLLQLVLWCCWRGVWCCY